MEDTVRFTENVLRERHIAPSHHSSHQLIQTRCSAGKHVVEIAHGDYNALGFTRSSRCVKNGGGVLWRERDGRGCNRRCWSGNCCEDFVKQRETWRTRPCG